MSLHNIFNSLATADPDICERRSTRRQIIKNWLSKLGLAMLPLAFGGLLKKAYGKPNDAVMDALRLALTLARLESSFYSFALQRPMLIPAGQQRQCIELMAANKSAHVSFVDLMIQSVGGSTDGVPSKFDYTGGRGTLIGIFDDALYHYEGFLAAAQTLAEIAVRAYKGALPDLMGNQDILQGILQLHSVEARHAAKLRQLRQENGFADIRPWITQMQSGIARNPAILPVYAGEGNTLQAGIDLVAQTSLGADAVTEAFDEPLGKEAVMSVLSNFILA